MLSDFRHRTHPRGVLFGEIERSFLTTSAVVITLVGLLVLFMGIYLQLV
jgi:hypothetical protein